MFLLALNSWCSMTWRHFLQVVDQVQMEMPENESGNVHLLSQILLLRHFLWQGCANAPHSTRVTCPIFLRITIHPSSIPASSVLGLLGGLLEPLPARLRAVGHSEQVATSSQDLIERHAHIQPLKRTQRGTARRSQFTPLVCCRDTEEQDFQWNLQPSCCDVTTLSWPLLHRFTSTKLLL